MLTPAQKQAVSEVRDALSNATGNRKRKLATMFLDIVDRNAYPEYFRVIPNPRALEPIRVNIEKNKYKDPMDAYTDLSLVFWNAMYYNETGSQIATDAQALKTILDTEWKAKGLPTPPRSPPPGSAQKVHGAPPESEPEEAPTPPPAQAAAAPTIHAPTPVAAQPIMVAAPSRPATVAAPLQYARQPDSDTEDEGDIPEPPAGGPSDLQIARHLESGLPRFSLDQSEEGGWMEDVKHEKHLEIMQAIKAYKDAAGVKLSTALEPQIPEDKLAITFKLFDSRSRSKTFYTSSRQFDVDLARFFESGRRYYLEKSENLAGVGGEEWAKVIALQRVANELTSSRCPPLPLSEPISYRVPLSAPGTNVVDSIAHKGFTIRAGDYVHVISGAEPGESQMGFGRGRAIVCRVTACWRDEDGVAGVTVRWYLRADDVTHLMPPRRKRGGIFEGEVVQTEKTTHHHMIDILERVACQHSSSAFKGRPRAPKWYRGWPLYVCGYRYDANVGRVRHIRRAEWFSASGGGGTEEEVLDLFERPLQLGTRPKRNTFQLDRSVVTAGGVAVSATEKLPPETARHFERDTTTGEVLWFPGAPLQQARTPGARHTMRYLEFLANKYDPKPQKEEEEAPVMVNGNGHAANGDAEMPDVEAEPSPPKRRRVEPETYISASEMIREAFASVA
ncbi:hypothetical protein HMN09_00029300 [Mycena chlorophos]|uniref:Uncharacterized protein n=1 Tax=Mycena chlorophos TaxID=658473 RepID=A0A8H6TR77_MYCCL|nr:hypothetical protein HMN09_00029300 [Mycena chlorophos]